MPHLLAHKYNNNLHLARWNNSPLSARKHLGAGYFVYTMSHDKYKNFIWGDSFSSGNADVACGFLRPSTRDGEAAVADYLYGEIKDGNSEWPYQGNDWNTQGWGQPCYWYFTGGICVSGATSPEISSEAAMAVTAYHFTLPERYRELGLSVAGAKIVYKGLGSFVQNLVRPTGAPLFYAKKTWDDNGDCWGSGYRLQADYYQDSQSLAVHLIHGSTLAKSNYNPAKCFFVYDSNGTAYELRNLIMSCANRIGRNPTNDELNSWFAVDMTNANNSHWKYCEWLGSRSTESSSSRYAPHSWALSHNGQETTKPLFSAGSGWSVPYISSADNYPNDDGTLDAVLTLTDADKTALASADGVWCVVHGLPMLSRKCLTGGQYLPTSSFSWESAPWRGATNQSAVGRYVGTEIESLDTFQLQVTLG